MARTVISYKDGHVYEFAPNMEPLYTAADGESLTFETIDSLNKAVQSDADLMDAIPEEVNAATGPVAVEGATPGDVLKVEIEDVRLNEDLGRVITAPGFGLLQDHENIEHPATRVTEITNDGTSLSFKDMEIPVDPVIGTIGVATSEEAMSTLTPHDHGGNLDTTDMTTGTTAYFPVFQDGAMLAMGDSKAAMADGEMCGTGAEIGTEIDVTVSVIADAAVDLERPLVDTGDAWKTVASAETMEDAVKMANEDLIELLAAEHEYTLTDAYLFSSLVGGLEISQVVDPLVTVRNSIPNEYLSNPF
ncbi:acetamidase/formamidase family protein [Haloarcula argentinensis]|uniref:Formamidase n=1 Tax=Haloarcula argentinensis TaxID=43776 RepID=A0A830FKZ8_HALAR|nr:acetamidase/formamidase family protein [Haloarcula argentinensis]EMA17941.1 acetamidase/formamidase family protein [Haloarcula argentinensis DSM 12282]MDS0255603.1 acetamidase/formamidase family protein [Haloarcula argentinensis]GGM47947.1 formamidase [Haloarcula argentinensis]